MIEFVREYINRKGIVVNHPETLGQQLEAIIAYAKTVENDCIEAERKLDIAVKALDRISSGEIKSPFDMADFAESILVELKEMNEIKTR